MTSRMDNLDLLSDDELRLRLMQYGFQNLPITSNTRKLLIKKLRNHMESEKGKLRRETSYATRRSPSSPPTTLGIYPNIHPDPTLQLSDGELRQRLARYGLYPNIPITGSTRKLLLKKLLAHMKSELHQETLRASRYSSGEESDGGAERRGSGRRATPSATVNSRMTMPPPPARPVVSSSSSKRTSAISSSSSPINNNNVNSYSSTNNNNHNKSLSPGSSRSSVYISPVIINDSEEEDYLRPTAGRVFGTSTPSSASALFRRTTAGGAYSSTPQARNTANAGHTPPASSSFGNHKSYLRHNNGAEALNESTNSNGSASSETSASSSPFVSEYTKRLLQLRGETVSHESYNSAISSAIAAASSSGSGGGGGGSNLNLNHSGAPISGNHFRSRYSVFPRYASDGGGSGGGGASSGINENDIVTHAVPSPDPPQIPLRAALGNLFAKLDEHYGFKQTFIPCALLCLFVAFLVFVAFMYMTISTDIASTLGTIDTKYDLCEGPAQDRGRCVVQSDIEPALELLKRVGTELKTRVEHSKCVDTSVTSYWMSADEVIRLAKEHDPSLLVPQAVKHLHTMEYLIGQNPQWRINHCDQDGNEIGFDEVLRRRASKTNYFAILKPKLPFTCMLYNKFHTFFVIVGVLGLVGIIAYLVNYFLKFVLYVKQKRKDQVNALISEIIQAVSQAAASAGGSESSDEGGLVVVNHLRDRLIAPDNRKKMEWAWLEALQFLEQHESRIQFEVGNRGGEDFKMMRWTDSAPLPTSTRSVPGGAKKWQSPAFDNTNKIPDPPTPCLKIRQMFDKYEVNDPNLRTIVQDAILEKVGARCKIYDIQLDRSTCCVYVRCATSQDAGIVHDEINGWWFDNRLVSIKFLRLERYLSRFPRALAGPACLKPSNRHNSSMPAAGPGANPLEREDDEDVEAEEDELDQELEC